MTTGGLLALPMALVAVLAVAQESTGRIEGHVVDSVTGEPVRRVSVNLIALPPGTARRTEVSAADGRFSFEGVEPGSYGLWAGRPTSRPGTLVSVPAGQVVRDVELRLPATGAISGQVVDEEERPVAKVMVMCRESMFGSMATTGSDGGFRIQGLPSGNCVLMAAPRGGEPETVEERALVTFYPSTTDEAATIPLLISPGQELSGITIALRKGRLHSVQGTVVVASPGLSLRDVRVILLPRSRVGILSSSMLKRESGGGVTLSPDGSFDLGLVSQGSYHLRAERKNDSRAVLGRMLISVSGEDLKGLVLAAREPMLVTGTMKTEGESELDLSRVGVQLMPIEGPQPGWASSTLSAEDTFTMEEIPAGEYIFLVSGLPEGAYVKSIRLGGRETTGSRLDLSGMETVPPIEVLVSPNGATVEGTVTFADKPTPGAWVCLIADPPRPELTAAVKSARSGLMGKFRLPGVTPGDYGLYAFEEPQPTSPADLGFFRPFESKAVKVTVAEGERKQVDLTLVRSAEVK